jgi:hypothetical protein
MAKQGRIADYNRMVFGQVPKFLVVVPKRQQTPVGCCQVAESSPAITTKGMLADL